MIECSECMTRLIGPQNHMLWIGLEPERLAAVLRRVGQFYFDCAKAAIDAAMPWLDGFVIWGDVAYKKGTFLGPTSGERTTNHGSRPSPPTPIARAWT